MTCDDSAKMIVCTTWGQYAQDSAATYEGQSVMIENGIISDYNGYRSITVGMGTTLSTNPSIQRSQQLIDWCNKNKHILALERICSPGSASS